MGRGKQGHSQDDSPVEDRTVSASESRSFCGCFEHSLDEKGRVSLPSQFRQAIPDGNLNVVLTNFICDGARCLEGYMPAQWRELERKLRERSRFDPQIRKLENFYISRAAPCALDGSGRITVPSYLRSYAGITRDVVFTSSLHGFRVWDKRVWELVFQEAESALLENPAVFADVDR